jgi:hypothetical protein
MPLSCWLCIQAQEWGLGRSAHGGGSPLAQFWLHTLGLRPGNFVILGYCEKIRVMETFFVLTDFIKDVMWRAIGENPFGEALIIILAR